MGFGVQGAQKAHSTAAIPAPEEADFFGAPAVHTVSRNKEQQERWFIMLEGTLDDLTFDDLKTLEEPIELPGYTLLPLRCPGEQRYAGRPVRHHR